MAKEQPMTADEQQEWIRQQYQIATKYLAEQGHVTDSVVAEESRYVIPFMSMWKLKALNGSYFWVICGDLPSDHNIIDIAKNAREAVRHFSMKWQLQAENLLQSEDKTQEAFAQLLIQKANNLYDLAQEDRFWDIAL